MLHFIKMIRGKMLFLFGILRTIFELIFGFFITIIFFRYIQKTSSQHDYRDALIICPSPSLNDQVLVENFRKDYVLSFVNSACLSPKFIEFKPERFFLIDPAFFYSNLIPSKHPEQRAQVDEVLSRIAEMTNWPMIVIVPWYHRNSDSLKSIANNPFITINGLSVNDCRGSWCTGNHFGFRFGFLNPVYRNVLVAAILYNLRCDHKKVFVWGANSNWLKNCVVDSDNQVLHSIEHTESQVSGIVLLNSDGTRQHYHTYLKQLSTTFEQYHVLQKFSKAIGKEIINITDASFIDAFKRSKDVNLFKS